MHSIRVLPLWVPICERSSGPIVAETGALALYVRLCASVLDDVFDMCPTFVGSAIRTVKWFACHRNRCACLVREAMRGYTRSGAYYLFIDCTVYAVIPVVLPYVI